MEARLSLKFRNMAFVCACLVVGIHLGDTTVVGSSFWWALRLLKSGLCSIAVPFFFFASGYFLAGKIGEDGWYSIALKTRLKTLLVPYLLWNVIYLSFETGLMVSANLVHGRALADGVAAVNPFSAFGLDPSVAPYLFTYWYIKALFILVAFSPLLIFLLRRTKGLALIGLWVLYALVAPGDEVEGGGMFKWTFSLLGLFYFSFGIFARDAKIRLAFNGDSKDLCIGSVSLIVGLLLVIFKHVGVLPYSILRPISIVFMLIGVWCLTPTNSWPLWLVSQSFAIYTLHIFTRTIGWMVFEVTSTTGYLVSWGLNIVACIGIAVLIKRLFSKTTALIFGGR